LADAIQQGPFAQGEHAYIEILLIVNT